MPETLTTDVLAYLCARSDTRGWAMSRECTGRRTGE